jgi:uncharacterized membrane protein (DUF485 family)
MWPSGTSVGKRRVLKGCKDTRQRQDPGQPARMVVQRRPENRRKKTFARFHIVKRTEGVRTVERSQIDWAKIAKNPMFVDLHRRKAVFLFGWWTFSTIFYFLLPIGAGSASGLFGWKIVGHINFGYFFALSQFFVSWIIAMYYASWANRVSDRITVQLVKELRTSGMKV